MAGLVPAIHVLWLRRRGSPEQVRGWRGGCPYASPNP